MPRPTLAPRTPARVRSRLLALAAATLAFVAAPAAGHAQYYATGAVVSGLTGASNAKCLDVPNSNTTDGTRLEIWSCNGGANQQFTTTSAYELRVLGKCVDDLGGRAQAGDGVGIYTCNGGANQKWTWDKSINAYRSQANSGLCLDVAGGNTANGTLIDLWMCNSAGQPNQRWSIPGGTWTRLSALMTDDGRCLYGSTSAVGAAACDMSYGVWYLSYNGTSNYYWLQHIDNSGTLCASAPSAAGQPVVLRTCDPNNTSERFYHIASSGLLQLVGTNMCLNLSGGQRGVSYQVVSWTCDNASWNERFAFALLMPASVARALGYGVPATLSSSQSLVSYASQGVAKATVINAGAGNIIAAGSGNVLAQPAQIIGAGAGNIVAATGIGK